MNADEILRTIFFVFASLFLLGVFYRTYDTLKRLWEWYKNER